jgi:enediyne biosynthesis protein E4
VRLNRERERLRITLGSAVVLAFVGRLGLGVAETTRDRAPFREVPSDRSGISWVHDNAMSPDRYLPETTGAGAAFFDFDNDGWMDVYLVNSGRSAFYRPRVPIGNALYRNNRDGTFTDVTDRAGVAGGTFGMGVAAGDYDGDGFPDLYITAYGKATLYRNNGDGTFADVTAKAGVVAEGWTTSALWFDFDNDGLLDLFVCSYVRYGVDTPTSCSGTPHGKRYYCVPRIFEPTASHLFRNHGDGTFRDVSAATGIARAPGKALGVVASDFNDDGLMDLFVTNDTAPNFLFLNRGQAGWEERGLAAEVAFSANGQARSGMGVDAGDYDGDGWPDVVVGNIDHELAALYRNGRKESFVDEASSNGIAAATQLLSVWGAKFFDYDADGWPDLFLANGHPDDRVEGAGTGVRYKEPLLLFHNEGGRYRDVSAEAGPAFRKDLSGRGLAVGDFDNDGRVDVLVANNGMAPVLLHNEAGPANHWLGVRLQGSRANRDAVGAWIQWSAGDIQHQQLKTAGGSYLSSHDPRLVLGLGRATSVDSVEVRWPGPSTRVERFSSLPVDRYVTLIEGRGITVASEGSHGPALR